MSKPDNIGQIGYQPGWLPDPKDPKRFRYWDGSAWTSRVIIDDPLDPPVHYQGAQGVASAAFQAEPVPVDLPAPTPGVGAQRLLLGLGGALVLTAVAAFVAFIWSEINPFTQSAILLTVALGVGAAAVRIKSLTGTREVLSVISWGIIAILAGAGPRFGYLPTNWYDLTFAVPTTIGAIAALTLLAAYRWHFKILKVVGWGAYILAVITCIAAFASVNTLTGVDHAAIWVVGLAGAAYATYALPSTTAQWNHRSVSAAVLASAATIPATIIVLGSPVYLITEHTDNRSVFNSVALLLVAALAYTLWRQASTPCGARTTMRFTAWSLLGFAIGLQMSFRDTTAWIAAAFYLTVIVAAVIPSVRQIAAQRIREHPGAMLAFITASSLGLMDGWIAPATTPVLPNTIVGLCGITAVLLWYHIDRRLAPAVWVACAALTITILTSVSYLIPGELTLEYLVVAFAAPALLAAVLTTRKNAHSTILWIAGLGSSGILTIGVWAWMASGSTMLDTIATLPTLSVPVAVAGLVGWFILAQRHTWAFWVIAAIMLTTAWVNLIPMGASWQINTAMAGVAYLIGSLPTRHRNRTLNSGIWLAPAITFMYVPYLLTYMLDPLQEPVGFLLVLSSGVILTIAGARWSALGLIIPGVIGVGLIIITQTLNLAQLAPAWVSLAVGGAALLAVGVRMEATRAGVKRSARWISSLN